MTKPSTPHSSPSTTTAASRPQKSMTLGVKVGLAFAAIGIVSILTTAICSHFLYTSVLQKASLARIDSVRVMVQNQIEGTFAKWRDDTVSLLPHAAAALQEASAPAAVASFFEQSGTASDARLRFLAETATSLGFESTLLFAPDGRLLKNVTDPSSTPPTAMLEVVKNCLQRQSPVTAIFFAGAPSPDTLRVVNAAPIITSQNRLSAVVVTTKNPTVLFQLLTFNGRPADAGLGQTGQAYLVDRDLKAMSPVRGVAGSASVQSDGIREALAGSVGASAYVNYAKQPVFGSRSRLKTDGLPWAVLVEQGRDEALAPARTVSLYVAGLGLGLIVVVSLIGAAFAKLFSKPIQSLEETMRRIRSGDESARAEVTSNDEIGQLAQSFNEMVAERNAAKDRISTENRRLQNNIQDLLLVVADASEGKLSVRAKKTEGVLGNVADALNQMLYNVGILIGEAKRVSAEVEAAAAGITMAAHKLTEGATDQTTQVNKTIGDVQNLTGEAQNVSENSREAAASATRTRTAAETGAAAIRDAVEFMERLRQSVQETAQKIDTLGRRSREISGIVASIGEISAETDVLAMNASIEAARAGEHGKGFTVVADQVRALADRTRLSTIEIEKLVRSIQDETEEAVRTMDHQTREVENGAKQVASAGQALGNIVDVSIDSSTLAEQISDSAAEQEKRAEAVLSSVLLINRIAEETRNKTVEFQQTSDQLARLARELNSQLANFDISREAGTPGTTV